MSLRLLPAFITDNDDDDENFTKWMSSYWGHSTEDRASRKRSFRKPARTTVDRRASLPSVSQLDVMKLSRLHVAAMASAPEQMMEVRPHQKAHRSFSDDNGRTKSATTEKRISTIPELSESFQRRLSVYDSRTQPMMSCRSELRRPRSGSSGSDAASASASAVCEASTSRSSGQRRKSADGHISTDKEQQMLRRHLSLHRRR